MKIVVNKELRKKLSKENIDIKSMLGFDTRGVAYRINNALILKITSDESEANSMAIIKEYPSDYIVKVYKVFQFKSDKDLYYIVEGRLQKLSDEEEITIDDLLENFIKLEEKGPDIRIADLLYQGRFDVIDKILLNGYFYNKELRILENLSAISKRFLEDMVQAARHLHKVGIKFHDYHIGNVMKDASCYKLIDLGFSEVAKKANIELKEILQNG